MTEPSFIAEAMANDHGNHVALKQWVNRQMELAKADHGCEYFRITNDPASVGHTLIEAWHDRPDDMGEPRWPNV